MQYKAMKKVFPGKFLTRYDLTYETEEGEEKIYEMVSRSSNMHTEEDLKDQHPDAVILILTDCTGNRILLNREFRMATGNYVYNFPAGLIDPGEMPEEAASRELWEETGLHLDRITEILPPSYSAVGFTNEISLSIIGRASGEFQKSTSAEEEIQAGWYTGNQVLELIRKEPFAARTQAYCYLWAMTEGSGDNKKP